MQDSGIRFQSSWPTLFRFIHKLMRIPGRILGARYYNCLRRFTIIRKIRGKLHAASVTVATGKALRVNSMIFPGSDWEEASPESLGINPFLLKEAVNYLSYEFVDIGGVSELVIIRNGYMLLKGSNVYRQHNIWSAAKTFTGTVLGLLVDDGKCNLNTFAMNYEPLLKEHYPEVMLRHFATMTSGYDAVGFREAHAYGNGLGDWGPDPYDVATPLFSPGEKFCYHDEAMFMFGRILTRITNESLHSFLKNRVTDYIGMGSWSWPTQGKVNDIDVNWGCGNAGLSALQLVRWGHLFLNLGQWNGKQLISTSWIDQISRNQVPTSIGLVVQRARQIEGRGVYGYNWWVNGTGFNGVRKMPDAPTSMYWAAGFNNNMCFIIPDWDMVVVRMGTSGIPIDSDKTWNEFFKRLGNAVT